MQQLTKAITNGGLGVYLNHHGYDNNKVPTLGFIGLNYLLFSKNN